MDERKTLHKANVHCLQRFDLSQLVQDLSSINLNDPWISSHFSGFPLDTGVFFCLTNFRKKTGEKVPFFTACLTNPTGRGNGSKTPCQGWPQGPPSEVFLELDQPGRPLGSALADGGLIFCFHGKKWYQHATPVGIQDEDISRIDYMHKKHDCQKRFGLYTSFDWPT